MTTTHHCPECGAAQSEGAPEGLCPQCLLKQALPTQPAAAGLVPPSSGEGTFHFGANLPATGTKMRYFGDYEILEEVARGGMGVVYKARQIKLNRIVAVKMILAGSLASETEVKRFLIEAQAAANLQHPNIVAIHEVGEFQGLHYFSMDYVEGKNLAEVCKEGAVPVAKAVRYVKAIAEAVHFAHQRGTLHRDLKPQNVLIDTFDQPRITDFGLAKQLFKESSLTLSSAVMGSPGYMPPEQAAGRNDQVGPSSDVYALGAILYQLLTGRAPFVGPSALEVMRQVREDEPVAPSKLNRRIPTDLETICLKCLEKAPERRYATARALAEDLERFQNHEPIEARRPSATRRAWSWTVRHPWPLTGAASIILLVIVGLLFGVWEQNKLLRWQVENPGRQPSFQPGYFFPMLLQAFLMTEFFLLQILPLLFFIRDRVRERLTRRKLAEYVTFGLAQVGFGLFLIFRLNAALVWTTPSTWFTAGVALAALTNIWFGFRLLWHAGHEFRTLQSGVVTASQPLALIRLTKYYPLILFLIIEAIFCGLFAQEWGRFFFCLGVVFGINFVILMGRMLWMARGEERLLYLPPLLLSGVMVLLGGKSGEFAARQVAQLLAMGAIGSVALFFLVRLERSLAPQVSPKASKWQKILGSVWRVAFYGLWGLPVLLVAVYQVENWRGKRAWEKSKAELMAKGAHLDWEYYRLKPVPDEQNIMKAPIMETWFLKDSPLKNTTLAKRYRQFNEALTKAPSIEVPAVEVIVVTPDSRVEVPVDAVVFDLANLQSSRQDFDRLCSHLPTGRCSLTVNNTLVCERAPRPGQKVSPIYLRSATSQPSDQLKNLFKQYGFFEPNVSPAGTPEANVFKIQLTGRMTRAEDVIQLTDAFKPEFEQIREALRRPGYYLDSISEIAWKSPIMNFVAVRTLAQMGDARARSYLLLNRPAEAWQELILANDFRRCLESNSWNLVTAMVDVAIAGVFVSSVEDGYAMRGWTGDQYAAIQRELEKVQLIPILGNGLAGERAAGVQLFNLRPEQINEMLDWEATFYSLMPHGWLVQNMRFVAEQLQGPIECLDVRGATVSPHRFMTNSTAMERRISRLTPYNFIAARGIPNFTRAVVTMAKKQTRANLAACAFALERYRVKHGQYSERLEALVPEFKAEVPRDVVNGEPLKYRREAPDRFTLYSIGWDLKDDQGKTSERDEQGDWVWTSYAP